MRSSTMPVSGCACPQKYRKLAFSSSSSNSSSPLEKFFPLDAAAAEAIGWLRLMQIWQSTQAQDRDTGSRASNPL